MLLYLYVKEKVYNKFQGSSPYEYKCFSCVHRNSDRYQDLPRESIKHGSHLFT